MLLGSSLLATAVTGALLLGSHAGAVNDHLISKSIELNRLRVTYGDVTSSASVMDPGHICGGFAKRVVVYNVPAAGEINSIVTKTRSVFSGTGVDQIGVIAVRAEQGGVQVSNGDIAVPDTDLTDTSYIENRQPGSGEYAFYDESDPWDVVAYICGKDSANNPVSLDGLDHGTVDFYISATRN